MIKRFGLIILPIILLVLILAIFMRSSRVSNQKDGLQLAQELMEKGKYASAVELLLAEEKKNPDSPKVALLLSQTYLKMREFLSAEQKCQKILSKEPNNKEFSDLLTEIKFEHGKHYWEKANRSLACENFLYVLNQSPSKEQISEIAFLTGGNYYLQRLTSDLVADYYPSFSHNGKAIIYHSDTSFFCENFGLQKKIIKKSQIFILDLATGKKLCISSGDSSEQNPRFSWDDKKIAYEKEILSPKEESILYHRDKDIFLRDLNTNLVSRLTSNHNFDGLPNFSPDNKKVVFVHDNPDSSISTLYQFNLNTGKREKVIPKFKSRFSTQFCFPYYPSFSPDGKKVLFQAGFRENKIYLVDLEKKSLTNLSTSQGEDFYPSFSFDGKKIVFISNPDDKTELYLMNPDGSNRTQLTYDGMDKRFPTFSPDGNQIIFVAKQPSEDERYLELYVLDLKEKIGKDKLKQRIEEILTRLEGKKYNNLSLKKES
jgi:Tol biopolymer transport system component